MGIGHSCVAKGEWGGDAIEALVHVVGFRAGIFVGRLVI
jgi:hypothetical protein